MYSSDKWENDHKSSTCDSVQASLKNGHYAWQKQTDTTWKQPLENQYNMIIKKNGHGQQQ